MNAWTAFKTGLSRALRYWQVLLVLYLVNFVAALGLALLPALSLFGLARSTVIAHAADGLESWLLIESLFASLSPVMSAGGNANAPSLLPALGLSGLIFSLTPLVAWILGSLLSGGMLQIYANDHQPFSWAIFWRASWRWFGAFLLLGVLQALLMGIVFLLVLLVGVPLLSASPILLWVLLLFLFLPVAVLLALFEITRVFAVLEGAGLGQSFAKAARFLMKRPANLLLYYAIALVLLFTVHALFRLGLMPWLPLQAWPLVLLVQQVFIVLRLFARGARLAGTTALVRIEQGPSVHQRVEEVPAA